MNNFKRKVEHTLLFFYHLDFKYILPGITLLSLQAFYYICCTILKKHTAHKLLRNIEVVISLDKIKFSLNAIPNDLGFIFENFIHKSYESVNDFVPQNGDTCLDIGANIGDCTLSWYQHNREGKIICCEPHPESFKRLQKNLILNDCANIEPIALAISNKDQLLEIFIDRNSSMVVINSDSKNAKTKYTVQAYTLDHLVKEKSLTKIALCKIDVEGHELEVLKGAKETLKITERLIIECHSEVLNKKVKEIIGQRFTIVKEIGKRFSLIFAERKIDAA